MLENLNLVLCGAIMPFLLTIAGIFFFIMLRGFYILHPVKTFKTIICSSGGFRSLSVALAGTLGVGNIVGVASAIIMGGPGAVFWMLISGFLAMSVKYAEVYLAMLHRRGCVDNYYGGAPYYIYDKMGKGRVGLFFGGAFALLCVFNSFSTGNLVQINSISAFASDYSLAFGIIFTVCVIFIISGGERGIQSISSILIPILSTLYIIISLYIIFSNFEATCVAFSTIFEGAFSLKSVVGGGVGFGIAGAIRYGFSRGLLSNEAGCGTAPTAHASSSLSAEAQGCLGVFEVFWDTIVLCLMTALVILVANESASEPITLVILSYGRFTSSFGKIFIVCSCVLFALATVCTQYYYGERCLRFISSSAALRYLYATAFLGVCLFASVISSELMWRLSDLVIAMLAIFNICFVLSAFREIRAPNVNKN